MTVSERDAKPPLVSIGLPVYNGSNYIEAAMASLHKQTYGEIEIIVSDNCSTDRTYEICAAIAEKDPRVRLTRTDYNIGAAGNYNRVVADARGSFFCWANHDDLWDPTYIEKCVAALDSIPTALLAYSKSERIDGSGQHIQSLNAGLCLDAARPVARLRRYHDMFIDLDRRKGWGREAIEGLWIPIYGVMRTEHLRRTSLIRDYISSDTVLLEELLIIGPFVEIEEFLFYKRDHLKRSMRESEAYDSRAQWFTGKPSGLFLFPRWRALAQRVQAAAKLPVSIGDKAGCLAETLTFYVRRPSELNALIKEIMVNFVRPVLQGGRGLGVLRKW